MALTARAGTDPHRLPAVADAMTAPFAKEPVDEGALVTDIARARGTEW